jgi:hypothetical protein
MVFIVDEENVERIISHVKTGVVDKIKGIFGLRRR